jgi:hypothetical protein
MIGRAFAAGRPAAPLPRRGTDAGAAPLDRDEYDGSKLAHSVLPIAAYSLSRCRGVGKDRVMGQRRVIGTAARICQVMMSAAACTS